jgi:hypothetical protein
MIAPVVKKIAMRPDVMMMRRILDFGGDVGGAFEVEAEWEEEDEV